MTISPLQHSPSSAATYDEPAEGFRYDPASQVTNILHQLTASSTQINKAEYLYNPVGNRTSLTDKRGAQTFGYDTLDRLTSASHPLLGTPQAFAYDAVGNRTTGGSVVNAGNQLTADTTHSYQYDDNGNLTRKTLLATGNYTQYTYDAENRLTKVEEFVAGNPTAAFTSTYRYDGLGRRIEKVANGQTKRYIYDGEDILLEYDGSNVLQARYTHGPGIDEPIAVTKGGSTFFYHQDGLGSVTDLTDSAGAAAKSYSYDAYGTLVEQTGTVEQPYTYTGREFDAESGLYYYRSRLYDPSTGRFLQKDPIGFLGGDSNFYSYVSNDPIGNADPNGLAKKGTTKYYWGDCNDAEVGGCKAMCELMGKDFESCQWKYSIRKTVRNGKVQDAIYKLPNGMSCSCKDRDKDKCPPPQPQPAPVPRRDTDSPSVPFAPPTTQQQAATAAALATFIAIFVLAF